MNLHKPSSFTFYQIISATFCVIVVLSNIISAKMVQLPFLHDFSIPAGLITYPSNLFAKRSSDRSFWPKKSETNGICCFRNESS